jgi:hypothetical protein
MESSEKEDASILPKGYSYHKEGYLWYILPAEKFDGLPETVYAEGKSFNRKSEFHVTVVNAGWIAREIGGGDPKKVLGAEVALQKILAQYVEETPILFVRFKDDLRLAVSSERESIAARCVMQNLEGYFERIKKRYNKEFPTQPAHVSIYTATGAAVGIDSAEQMESFKKVELPEVQQVLDKILI